MGNCMRGAHGNAEAPLSGWQLAQPAALTLLCGCFICLVLLLVHVVAYDSLLLVSARAL